MILHQRPLRTIYDILWLKKLYSLNCWCYPLVYKKCSQLVIFISFSTEKIIFPCSYQHQTASWIFAWRPSCYFTLYKLHKLTRTAYFPKICVSITIYNLKSLKLLPPPELVHQPYCYFLQEIKKLWRWGVFQLHEFCRKVGEIRSAGSKVETGPHRASMTISKAVFFPLEGRQ